MNRLSILNQIIRKMNFKTYLEIGIAQGWLFSRVKVFSKFGVDPMGCAAWLEQKTNGTSSRCFKMTSDEFFLNFKRLLKKRKIDIAFVDGLHTYRQALRDVNHCLEHLVPRGFVLMHDCNPPSATIAAPVKSWEHAKRQGLLQWNRPWCGDVWKAVVHLRATRKDLRIFVLDCDWGVALITQGEPRSKINLTSKQVRALTYKDLAKSRKELLDLRNPRYLYTFLDSYLKQVQY